MPAVTVLPDFYPEDGTTATLAVYQNGTDGAEVRLCTIAGGGHTWPGGAQYLPEAMVGKTSRDFEASAELWAFFKRFTRPGAKQ